MNGELFSMHDTFLQLLFAQIIYLSEIFLFLMLFASYYFATEKKFDLHQKIVRYMVLTQTIVTTYMFYSFFFTYYGSNFTLHALMGLTVYVLILYTFFLMEHRLPESITIPNSYKPLLMRITSVLWGLSILGGIISLVFIVD